ncbi:hypothetical protein LTR47_000744 [Exophiala xenobiotica]|nr:hypothetical protein LTR47_000744 [Exophiala xenobiotica]KAK5250156.1 hypothetical protein LTS06_005054 [Exophiala xenobiotica]KAK5355404.1 hypothetical protein LTR61_001076 [Exophiala xenobiotica]KAK5386370.1 hypothetical protein LTS03_001643 [Exophiala xenobiotica]
MAFTVAVIGAGPTGLMALKNLKEDGFEVTGFEKRGYVGGLWKQSHDSSLSVTENTIFNSSRFRSAISDYPMPEHYDDFPTAKQIHHYMESYCDHFGLRAHIKLNAEIKTFKRQEGQWALTFEQNGTTATTQYFDKVLVCTGSFVSPRSPKLAGIENFQGMTLHSVNFPDPSRFDDQNVLLVGLHATAQDLTVELSTHAKKVYIAHKNGLVMLPRFTPDGRSMDQAQSLAFFFVQLFMETWFPTLWIWILDKILASMTIAAFPYQPKEWNFTPFPSTATTTPLVADVIYPYLKSGFATPVAAVREITGPKSVRLADDRLLEDIDAIIYCTGYDFSVSRALLPAEHNPFPGAVAVAGQPPHLYRNIFPLHDDPAIRNSLAFLGLAAVPFPGFTLFELPGMAVSQIWCGKSHLPPLADMKQWRHEHLAWRAGVLASTKNTGNWYSAFVRMPDYMAWLDETAGTGLLNGHFGLFSTEAWRFWWRDREFYNLCKNGVFSPSIWRLFDMGKRKAWPAAKDQIIRDNQVAEMRQKERVKAQKAEDGRKIK